MEKSAIDAWLMLYERCRFAGEYLMDRNGAPWRARDYQVGSLESYASRKVHCDGRDVGKTTEIELLALWASVACPNREMLVATQSESHLYPLMKRIAERLETSNKIFCIVSAAVVMSFLFFGFSVVFDLIIDFV